MGGRSTEDEKDRHLGGICRNTITRQVGFSKGALSIYLLQVFKSFKCICLFPFSSDSSQPAPTYRHHTLKHKQNMHSTHCFMFYQILGIEGEGRTPGGQIQRMAFSAWGSGFFVESRTLLSGVWSKSMSGLKI